MPHPGVFTVSTKGCMGDWQSLALSQSRSGGHWDPFDTPPATFTSARSIQAWIPKAVCLILSALLADGYHGLGFFLSTNLIGFDT